MATNEALKTLPSNENDPFHPGYKKDLTGVDDKERASKHLSFSNFVLNTDGLDDITDGQSTKKLWKLATTHKDVYLPIRTVINLAFWVQAKVVPNTRNDYEKYPEFKELDDTIISFVERVLNGQKFQTFERMLRDLVTYGKICGFAVAEKLWQAVDGFWICDYKIKRSFEFTARTDRYSNLQEIWYEPRGKGFHPSAFIWAPWGHFGGNWLGQSDLIPIRHDILSLDARQRMLDTVSVLLSKRPVISAYNDSQMSPEEIDKWKRGVDNVFNGKGNSVLHTPALMDDKGNLAPQFQLTIPESREGADAIKALQESIAETKKDIKRSLGVPDDMGLTSVPSGSWAKAKEEFSLLVSFAEEIQEWVQDTVNDQIINELVSYNWPEGTLPKEYCFPRYEFSQIEEQYEVDKAEFIKLATESGYLDPTNDLEDLNTGREAMGFEPKTETTEAPIEEQPAPEAIQESVGFVQKVKGLFKIE